ncbi:MAG: TPM domain-containing protein [Muribaculum sp.]|nr:TPM domain-containing protein [Muribaculum sp.]
MPNTHLQDRTKYVSNPDAVLTAATVATLDSMLYNLQRATTAEVVVVVVDRIEGGDIDTFGTELFSKWGIGKSDNDNGLLFLVSKDDRKMVIRTGYGMEGLIPDIIAGRIIRNVASPHFKAGDYDGGVLAVMNEINRIVSNPEAAQEIASKYGPESRRNADDGFARELFNMWLVAGVIMAIGVFALYVITLRRNKAKDRFDRYQALSKIELPALVMSFLGIGIPFISFFIILMTMRRLRTKRRLCPNCHHKMHRLDEQTDNQYLTPAQDTEERLKSVDYDVWLCDNCGELDILPYVNKASTYKVCPVCGARACSLRSERVVQQPTYRSEGLAVKEYVCHNCGRRTNQNIKIPKLAQEAPIIIGGLGAGRGFGGGGGGFSGGSFGGGMTGGGGASGGW